MLINRVRAVHEKPGKSFSGVESHRIWDRVMGNDVHFTE